MEKRKKKKIVMKIKENLFHKKSLSSYSTSLPSPFNQFVFVCLSFGFIHCNLLAKGGNLEVLFVAPLVQIIDQISTGVEILIKLLFHTIGFGGEPKIIDFRVKPKSVLVTKILFI